MNIKKLLVLNVPYVVIGLIATKLGQGWRLAEGINASEKVLTGCFFFGAKSFTSSAS